MKTLTILTLLALPFSALAGDWPQAKGLLYATIKVAIGPLPVCLPSRDGPYMRSRFREALLGSAAHT